MLSAIYHMTGIVLLFAMFSAYSLSASVGLQIVDLMSDSQFSSQILGSLFVLFGLTVLIWFVGVFAFRRLDQTRRRDLRKTRGSIMVETLIVLPVFLLLTSGLAQMAINSMAGILTTVGAFEAGRTIAVWGPEIGNERLDGLRVDSGDVLEKARLAVATVVTPVARSGAPDVNACTESPALRQFLDGMVSVGLTNNPTNGAVPQIWSYIESFGTRAFSDRAPAKLKSAYCAVSIDGSSIQGIPHQDETSGADFVVTVNYDHKLVFPMVSLVFGRTLITRSYRMRSQIPPNDCLPESPNFFNLNNCNQD